ncbi:hypothetical protein BTA51_15880 [Hahella sp. CCB-MM4]|uniref:UPF0175 family protein n=1 Tax=Hahella sp. (strain CCB-MM4) TaxID=1926491 RepID=UPI000B9B9E0F|nr:UPF0175 family protein [Hahella sp. CCB-MM4]OZG72586.1 hypothetical protein BTA51_15880 [Hahella sp. CCB-MM4]
MKIEIPDDIAATTGLTEKEMAEFLAVSLYKKKLINGVAGGEILGISEIEFHGLLEKFNEYVNYDVEDYLEDSVNLKD